MAAEELAETRAHYYLLAENASELVFRANLANEFEWVSPAAEDLLGVSAASLVGKPMSAWLHPDDLRRMAAALTTMDAGAAVS